MTSSYPIACVLHNLECLDLLRQLHGTNVPCMYVQLHGTIPRLLYRTKYETLATIPPYMVLYYSVRTVRFLKKCTTRRTYPESSQQPAGYCTSTTSSSYSTSSPNRMQATHAPGCLSISGFSMTVIALNTTLLTIITCELPTNHWQTK